MRGPLRNSLWSLAGGLAVVRQGADLGALRQAVLTGAEAFLEDHHVLPHSNWAEARCTWPTCPVSLRQPLPYEAVSVYSHEK